jgi:hypothetical protein
MSNLKKARIHSVDSDGTIIEDVDVYTSGDAVILNNDKTLENIYQNEIGNVANLNTDNKSVVDAINENTYNIDDTNSKIKSLSDNLSASVIATPTISYGMNNVITNSGKVSTSPEFSIKGKTLVNLLGKDGNCEDVSKWNNVTATTNLDGNIGIKINLTGTNANINNPISKYNLDTSKYYLFSAYLKNGNATSVKVMKDSTGGGTTISSATVTDTTKFNRVGVVIQPSDFNSLNVLAIYVTGTSGQYAYVDGIMINEITSSEYALGVDTLLSKYPYVDSYTCLTNPYLEIKHDNLIRNGNGEEGTAWWTPNTLVTTAFSVLNGVFSVTSPSSSGTWVKQILNVKPNTNYYLQGTTTNGGSVRVFSSDVVTLISESGTFNSDSNSKIAILMHIVSPSTTCTFRNIMLVEGTTAPSAYKPCRIERTVLETKLTSDDSITYSNGKVTGQIWWKHKTLFGKDYDWQFDADATSWKSIKLAKSSLPNFIDNGDISSVIFTKYDSKILTIENIGTSTKTDSLNILKSYTNIYPQVSDTDTGWTENINPNNDEVKCFMNGWKALFSTNGRYVTWISIVDGSLPSGGPSTKLSSTYTSGSTSLVVENSSIFSVGDGLALVCDDGTVWGRTITAISSNTLTISAITHSASIGTVVVKEDDGIASTPLLNYCKNNVAPGYPGYQLHYKLQNPEPTTDLNCNVKGDIPKFDVGDNYLYLDSGIILEEVANPVLGGGSNNYYLNDTTFNSPLKYKVESISNAYRNLIFDSKYNRSGYDTGRGYGREFLAWTVANFDINSTYTVDYKILATQAPQIGVISCSYGQDIVGTIENIQEEVNNRQQHDSILDSIVDLSLYETIDFTNPYSFRPNISYYHTGGNLYVSILLHFGVIKKVMPIVSISSFSIWKGQGTADSIDVTNKFNLNAVVPSKSSVFIRWYTSDGSTITDIKNYGCNIGLKLISDCRGRI